MMLKPYLTLSLAEALAVVVTTALMYVVFAAVLRWWGQRLFATTSAATVAMASVLGAIVGRTSLGLHPDLEGGLLALGTLLLLERAFGRVRTGSGPGRHRAMPLVVDGRIDVEALRGAGLSEQDLWARLRLKGVVDASAVTLAVLERDGQISVLHGPIDPAVAAGVRGADELPSAVFRRPG